MSLDIAEVVERFTEVDRRTLTVRRIHRVLALLPVPIVGLVLMMVGLLHYATGWALFAWLALSGVVGYALAWTGEELCSIALQLLERNTEELRAMGEKAGE